MSRHQSVHDRHPESCAARLPRAGWICSEEPLEDTSGLLRGHSRPVVLDMQSHERRDVAQAFQIEVAIRRTVLQRFDWQRFAELLGIHLDPMPFALRDSLGDTLKTIAVRAEARRPLPT